MTIEYSAGGLYQLYVPTGTIAAGLAAASEIFQFRNASSTKVVKILYIGMSAAAGATGFTAGSASFSINRATGWSAAGTGGTAITVGSSLVEHTGQIGSVIAAGDIRVATTAALGAGTKTLASNASFGLVASAGAAGQTIVFPSDLMYADGPDFIPFTLAANEGIALLATVPATGTWQAGINIAWAELPV